MSSRRLEQAAPERPLGDLLGGLGVACVALILFGAGCSPDYGRLEESTGGRRCVASS